MKQQDEVATASALGRGAERGGGARLRLARTTDGTLWDALVDGLTAQPGFHRWDWLELQARANDAVVERLLVCDGDRPVGVFPVPRRSPRAIEGFRMPFPYLGPLVPAGLLAPAIAALRAWQRRHGLVYGRFELGPGAPGDTTWVLTAAGCAPRTKSTVVVDLAHGSTEAMRAAYSTTRRKDLRRLRRAGTTVRDAVPGEVAALLPLVLEEAFAARGTASPYLGDIGERVEAWAAGRDDVAAFTALVDGEPAGVQVVLGGGTVALSWAGGGLRRFRDAKPNVLLHDRILEWAVGAGQRGVDLCGSVDDGVLAFKLSFGGTEQPYAVGESTLVPLTLLRTADSARRLIRR